MAQAQSTYEPYTFRTLAGLPPGSVDGTGSAARFRLPRGMAADSSGNVYVGDTLNFTIRKITSAAAVSTLAGVAGEYGSADGTGTAARFGQPAGIAVDSAGNVYVADAYNFTIRKITPAGSVTTLAGLAGHSGSTDGAGSAARFNYPSAVAVNSAGNVYVADSSNNTIRKITPAGVVSTLAGLAGSVGADDGTGGAARFNYPSAVTVDSAGNVYVADQYNCTIRKITPAAVVTTLAGLAGSVGSDDGTGSAARFSYPDGVAVDGAGNVYVADQYNCTIRKITPAAVVTTLAGSVGNYGSTDGTSSDARFNQPAGVAVDSPGNVYVADLVNCTVRKITPASVVTTLAGTASPGTADGTGNAARFYFPNGLTVDSVDNVYVGDSQNSTIRKITPDTTVSTLAGFAGAYGSADGLGSAARFNRPIGMAVDSTGTVYVGDSGNNTIRRVTAAGVVSTLAGLAGSFGSVDGTGSVARFNFPNGVAVDSSGNVYVADTSNHTIRKITPAAVVTTLAGLAGSSGSADGTGSTARFHNPTGVAVDSSGSIYVADSLNCTVRKITPAGVVSTLAGLAGSVGSADGMGSAARFYFPKSVAVDSSGNVYVADTLNFTVRKITPAAVVTTLAGLAGSGAGSDDGIGSAARFGQPCGVAADSAGNVHVADTFNNAIRVSSAHYPIQISFGTAARAIQAQQFTPPPAPPTYFDAINGGVSLSQATAGYANFQLGRGSITDSALTAGALSDSSSTYPSGAARGVAFRSYTNNTDAPLTFRVNAILKGQFSEAPFGLPTGPLRAGGAIHVFDRELFSNTVNGSGLPVPQFLLGGYDLGTAQEPASVFQALLNRVSGALLGNGQTLLHDGPFNQMLNVPLSTGVFIVEPHMMFTVMFDVATYAEARTLGSQTGGGRANFINTLAPADNLFTDADGNAIIGIVATSRPLRLFNISTRLKVDTGDNALIGGFIVNGSEAKKVILRAIGPSLTSFGVPGALADPTLELHDGTGAIMAMNDNWKDSQQAQIEATGIPPSNDLESAIVATLDPGSYTAVMRGKNGGTGVGLVEGYSLDLATDAQLANISTRGFVDTGDNVMIGGIITGPTDAEHAPVMVRAIGPSLSDFGVQNALQDPTLELHDGSGTTVASNDDWKETQQVGIEATGIPPINDKESAILATLAPGSYTAIVRGKNDGTGVGLVEVYNLQ